MWTEACANRTPCLCQVVRVYATTWESVRSILAETKLPLISEDPVCRVVDGVLEAPRLQKWIPDSSVTRAAICTGGRYVVTGGSGALGESCVQWLLGRGAGHVTILSRSEPEFSDERVRWLKCDVSKAADLKATAAKCKDSQDVNGIIHAAGVLADKMLAEQTEQNIRKAFGPKVLAALLLPSCWNQQTLSSSSHRLLRWKGTLVRCLIRQQTQPLMDIALACP